MIETAKKYMAEHKPKSLWEELKRKAQSYQAPEFHPSADAPNSF